MPDKFTLEKSLNELRKMKRAIQLRQETDPNVVANVLESVLLETLALRSADDQGMFSRGAVSELKELRNAILVGQINAGVRTQEMVGKFSLILDELDNFESKPWESQDEYEEKSNVLSNFLSDKIPSAETIISALITANPLFGYIGKIGLDAHRARKEYKKERERERKERLAEIREQNRLLEEQLAMINENGELIQMADEDDDEAELLPHEGDEPEEVVVVTEDDDEPRIVDIEKAESIEELLEDIHEEMQRLRRAWEPDSKEEQDEILERAADEEIVESLPELERIADEAEEANELERHREDLEEARRREEELEARKFQEASVVPQNIEGDTKLNFVGGLGKFGIGATVGAAVAGIVASLKKVLGMFLNPFRALMSFIKWGGTALKPLAGLAKLIKGNVIVSGLVAIYDFFDGLFRADKILGKNNSAISMAERLEVALISALRGFLEIPNWIVEKLFGKGFLKKNKDEATRQVMQWKNNVINFVTEAFDYVMDGGKKLVDGVIFFGKHIYEKFGEVGQDMKDRMSRFVDYVVDFFTIKIPNFKDDAINYVGDKVDGLKEATFGLVDSLLGQIIDVYNEVTGFFSNLGLMFKNKLLGWVSGAKESVFDFKDTVSDIFSSYANNAMEAVSESSIARVLEVIPKVMNNRAEDIERRQEEIALETIRRQHFNPTPMPIINNSNQNVINNTRVTAGNMSTMNNEPAFRRMTGPGLLLRN